MRQLARHQDDAGSHCGTIAIVRVIYCHPGGRGWDTVTLLARLSARLLEAELVELAMSHEPSKLSRLPALLPRRRGDEPCLVIAPQPGQLQALLSVDHWRRGYSHVSAWVIDSFLTDRIPFLARGRGHIDQFFVTDAELVSEWELHTRTPTHWLPFGSDVLDLGSAKADRPVDVLRVGRMPDAWEDDARVRAAVEDRGLTYRGRTPFHTEPLDNQKGLLAAMADSKFVLAFNNVAAPAVYTHPTQQYLTGRWTDALSSGAIVAGRKPECIATDRLLWEGATLQFPGTDLVRGVDALVTAVADWTPGQATLNHRAALERLDWRLRLEELCAVSGIPLAGVLQDELARLARAVEHARRS